MGAGSSASGPRWAPGGVCRSVTVGDFDGDGKQDLALNNISSANVSVLLGNGNGGYKPLQLACHERSAIFRGWKIQRGWQADLGRRDYNSSNGVWIASISREQRAKTISAFPATRAAGEPAANSRLAPLATLKTRRWALPSKSTAVQTATVNGVTVTLNPPFAPNTSGQVFADVAAFCTATNATFTLAVIDSANQMTTATLTVTVTPDRTAPLVTAPAPTVASASGSCQAAIPNVIPGTVASDNCGGTITLTQTPAAGALVGIGPHTITVTATDAAGNSNTATTAFTVTDTTPPTPNLATLPTITVECSTTVTAPTATDNCAGQIAGTTTDALTYSSQGTFIVHWSYDDSHGNVSTQTQTVIVQDTTLPVVGLTPSTDGLAAYYKFDEASGTNTFDSSGNSHTGQLIGTSWINIGLPSLGFANPSALSFNGTSDYVLIPPSAIDDLSAGTIAAWVYLNTRDQEVITAKQHNIMLTQPQYSPLVSAAPPIRRATYRHRVCCIFTRRMRQVCQPQRV